MGDGPDESAAPRREPEV
jgi:hypothetical protein